MRTVIPLLQLLALGHQAAASVCRPRVTSSSVSIESVTTSASTAASSTVSSTGSVSTTWSSTETASSSTETVSLSTTESASSSTETVSLSTTETASSFTESASLSTTESATISTTETASSSTETASLSTTDSSTVVSTTSSASESISADSSTITSSTFFTSTTSTAEASSTTSSVPEGPPELLDNRDFENKDSLSPWVPYQTFETVAISTDVFHQGEQSARVTWTSPVTPFGQNNYYIGIRQPVSASKLLADTPYEFSVWIKMAPGIRCDNFGIACTVATGYTPASYKAVPLPGSGDWEQAKTTCQWTQAGLNLGPGVRVFGYCREAEYYVDDASLKQIV